MPNSQLKGAMRSARDEVRAEYHSQIAQAKLLNKSELTALERQESLKPEDLRAIEKIRQLIDRLRGHTDASGTQLDLGLT